MIHEGVKAEGEICDRRKYDIMFLRQIDGAPYETV